MSFDLSSRATMIFAFSLVLVRFQVKVSELMEFFATRDDSLSIYQSLGLLEKSQIEPCRWLPLGFWSGRFGRMQLAMSQLFRKGLTRMRMLRERELMDMLAYTKSKVLGTCGEF